MAEKPKIPSWQRASADSPSTSPVDPTQHPESSDDTEGSASSTVQAPTPTEEDVQESTNSTLLDQASRFLDDPTIRDAPREKKVAFLESKGVTAEDIETLLGSAAQEGSLIDLEEAGERAWSTAPPKSVALSQPSTQPPQPRDIPPIVTYPEFLAQTEKPPPLITTQRLVNTAYVTGGLMATIYGISKYLVAPMTQNMTESRHDFASHAQEQLQELNKRLGDVVSVDPATKAKPTTDVVDDISEADSDPTELYHRDYGTQTTPELSRRPSVSNANDPQPIVTAHENRLKIIKSHLQELETTRSNDSTFVESLKTKISDLSTYLNDMSYQSQYYSSMNGLYGSNFATSGVKDGKNDQIEALKGDIRAVKGVFLSARNFPTGGRKTSPMSSGRVGA